MVQSRLCSESDCKTKVLAILKYLLQKILYALCFSQVILLLSCGDKKEDIPENINNEVKKDSATVNKIPDTVSVSEMKTLMEQPGMIVLDVRSSADYDKKNTGNTLNLDYNSEQFEENITFLDKEMTYLVLSDSDEESANAVAKLRSKGYKSSLIKNGMDALK